MTGSMTPDSKMAKPQGRRLAQPTFYRYIAPESILVLLTPGEALHCLSVTSERCVIASFQIAEKMGFKGEFREWEELSRIGD